jgi:Valyl-tRNA synthetase
VKDEVESAAFEYRFNDIAQAQYKFIWNEFCDWFVEMAKGDLYGEDEKAKDATRRVLLTVLSETMVLLHPVMPFRDPRDLERAAGHRRCRAGAAALPRAPAPVQE